MILINMKTRNKILLINLKYSGEMENENKDL